MVNRFFDSHEGTARNFMAKPRRAGLRDVAYDGFALLRGVRLRLERHARTMRRQRVLVVGVEVPARRDDAHRVVAELARSRHEVIVSLVPMQDRGKLENIDVAIGAAGQPLADFDWLIIVDDDVALPSRFTDLYLAAASLADLTVSQPAHCFRSYASYEITRRRTGSVRRTGFVEIGPLTVLRRDAFATLVPFPPSRSSFGIDVLWGDIARRQGWRMGIVDALPIRHLRPVGRSYDFDGAIEEGRALLRRFDVTSGRADLLWTSREPLGR